jgi:hypothetical protein
VSEKLELKEKLAAIDLGARSLWDDVNEDERKRIKGEFFILNRYISSVKSNLITMLNRRERVNKTTEAATLSFDALSYFCPRTN